MGQAIQAQCKQSDLKAMDFHSQEKDLNNISAVVDFSSPDGFIICANYCIENKIPLISGTTGLSDEHLEIVSTAKKSIPILLASNMSLGIANLKSSIKGFMLLFTAISFPVIKKLSNHLFQFSWFGLEKDIIAFNWLE